MSWFESRSGNEREDESLPFFIWLLGLVITAINNGTKLKNELFLGMPYQTKSHSWESIEKYYKTRADETTSDKLLQLVTHIIESHISERLFAIRSHDKLIISIYQEIEITRDALHIEYNQENSSWKFEYFSNPYKPAEFQRQYPADKGIEKFDNFIKMINW